MSNLWQLVWGKQQVDPGLLADAIESELLEATAPDFRTKLLIRDSTVALGHFWGGDKLETWLRKSEVGQRIKDIMLENLGEAGFHFLGDQIVEKTEPEVVRTFLRDLGSQIDQPLTLTIGGSIALILAGKLDRGTDDIDIVDEVPEAIRSKHALLENLQNRYRLMLTHFQSHFLPNGWEQRRKFLGSFGRIEIYTVDPYDIFVGKLFSNRTKDLDDIREMATKLTKDTLVHRTQTTSVDLRKDATLSSAAERNWYVLFGEDLPTPQEH
ncbi:MAG TPA: DUF6036 family nucleotidyltransferase [Planktothrix sp.]|jgi:hypothetical protein